MCPDINQTIETLAVYERFQSRPYVDIRRGLTSRFVTLDPYRVFGASGDMVTHICFKPKFLAHFAVRRFKVDRHERRVIHSDSHLLHWGHKKIFSIFQLQNRRKQARQFKPPNWCAFVEPCTIPGDTHVYVTAKRGIPQMHRRQAARARGLYRCQNALRRGRHGFLCTHGVCHSLSAR